MFGLAVSHCTAAVQNSIKSWRKYCPDWEIIQWNENNFPINDFRWTREAVARRKFAFAADFIRLWVLKSYGGVLRHRCDIRSPHRKFYKIRICLWNRESSYWN